MSPTAERVFEVARAAGLEKRDLRKTLASICGVSYQAVRDWESGSTSNIKHEHLVAISRYFGVSIDYLVAGASPAEGDERYSRALRQLRGLPEDQRAMFLRMLDAAASDQEA